MTTYRIRRMYFDSDHPHHNRIIDTGLTLEEAQAHCQREDTHEKREDGYTIWFDGYEEE